MQILTRKNTTNFEAIKISPNGYKALSTHNKKRFLNYVNIEELQSQRLGDKYIDAVINGRPDEYGHYYPVLYLKDKVLGKIYKDVFKCKFPDNIPFFKVNATEGRSKIMTKLGKLLPDEVVELVFKEEPARYFTFADIENATKFKDCIYKNRIYKMQLGIVEALELYYRNSLDPETEYSTELKSQKDKYLDFILDFKKEFGDKQLHEMIPDIVTEENLLGSGNEKKVYKIDNMPDYVLCVIKNKYDPTKPITPFCQHFQTNSVVAYEEPIVINDNGMYIKKNTLGHSFSIKNRVSKNHGMVPITYDDVNYFISQLKEVSSYPVKSFIKLAQKLQSLNENGIKIDLNNPNNLLIDAEIKSIDLIDLNSNDNKPPYGTIRPVNGLSDLEAVLCDSMLYLKLLDLANDEDKVKMDEFAKIIIKKCSIASKVSNLGNFPDNTKLYFSNLDKETPILKGKTRLQKYEDFRQHFKDFVSEEIVSTQYNPDKQLVSSWFD